MERVRHLSTATLLLLLLLLLPLLPQCGASRRIVEITDRNFVSYIGTKYLTVVLFYSAGCQPCVNMMTVMHRVSASLSRSHADVQFGRVDVSQQPLLTMRHHAAEVPQLKVFPHSSTPVTFHGELTDERLLKFLRGLRLQSAVKAGLARTGEHLYGGVSASTSSSSSSSSTSSSSAATSTPAVTSINASNYETVVLANDTNTVLALYTPECGRDCVEFDRIAEVFRHEQHHVVFAKADVTKEPLFARYFQAQRNPTLLWFPKGDKNNIVRYGGDVDLHEIVGFINDMTGTRRQPDGSLEPGAGTVAELDTLLSLRATDLVLGRNMQHLLDEAQRTVQQLPHSTRYTDYYLDILRLIRDGQHLDKVLEAESDKIMRRLQSDRLGTGERDEQLKLHNIISGITNIAVRHLQEERHAAEEAATKKRREELQEEERLRYEQQQQRQQRREETSTASVHVKEEL